MPGAARGCVAAVLALGWLALFTPPGWAAALAPETVQPPAVAWNGHEFKCSPGVWRAQPSASFSNRWPTKTNSDAEAVPVSRASAATYAPTLIEAGEQLACEVMASNRAGMTSANSRSLSGPFFACCDRSRRVPAGSIPVKRVAEWLAASIRRDAEEYRADRASVRETRNGAAHTLTVRFVANEPPGMTGGYALSVTTRGQRLQSVEILALARRNPGDHRTPMLREMRVRASHDLDGKWVAVHEDLEEPIQCGPPPRQCGVGGASEEVGYTRAAFARTARLLLASARRHEHVAG